MLMRLAILETGDPPGPLKNTYPSYGAMMEIMLAPLVPNLTVAIARVFEDETPPPIGQMDAVLTTGSAAGVYEEHDWIAPSEDYLRAAAGARKPQVGICFGHQLMAQAFGGRVQKVDKGWGVGVHAYDIDHRPAWMTPPQSRIACAVSHQDQVVDLPASGRALGGSDFCPNGVVEYAHAPAISFQPHPEFTTDYARDLLTLRRDRIGDGLVAAGLASFEKRSDRAILAQWIAAFFAQNR